MVRCPRNIYRKRWPSLVSTYTSCRSSWLRGNDGRGRWKTRICFRRKFFLLPPPSEKLNLLTIYVWVNRRYDRPFRVINVNNNRQSWSRPLNIDNGPRTPDNSMRPKRNQIVRDRTRTSLFRYLKRNEVPRASVNTKSKIDWWTSAI